jgi:glutamate-ammonia-ligase adenylyltransferase
LQVLHGGANPELRTPSTLLALAALRRGGLLADEEAERLEGAYLFLRRAIEALRMVRGEARDLVLPARGTDALEFLARRLGRGNGGWDAAARGLADEAESRMAEVAALYDRRFGRRPSAER